MIKLKKTFSSIFAVLVLAASLIAMRPAMAVPVLGEQLYYTGGDVTVEVLAPTAAYTSTLSLYLFSPTSTVLASFGTNHDVGLTTTINPLTDLGFAVGDELIFGIFVHNTSNTFYMGPGSRNPDGIEHAVVDVDYPGGIYVGFEDLLGGGDFDYDDHRFLFSGGLSPVPEPGALVLLAVCLLSLLIRRRTQ